MSPPLISDRCHRIEHSTHFSSPSVSARRNAGLTVHFAAMNALIRHYPHLRFLAAATALALTSTLSAQTLFTNPITATNPNTANPFSAGQITQPNLTATGIGRGSGLTSSNANDRYSATSWNSASLDANDYFTWTLTPATGYTLSLTNLIYTAQTSGTGPSNFSLRTSADTFTTSLGTPTATGATITLTGASFQGLTSSLEVRLYGWAATSTSGSFSVNDFSFNGSMSAVPEPSTYATLAGAAALSFSCWQRRRQRLTPSPPTPPPPSRHPPS